MKQKVQFPLTHTPPHRLTFNFLWVFLKTYAYVCMYIYYSKWGFVQLDFIIQQYRKINTRIGLSKRTEKFVHYHF